MNCVARESCLRSRPNQPKRICPPTKQSPSEGQATSRRGRTSCSQATFVDLSLNYSNTEDHAACVVTRAARAGACHCGCEKAKKIPKQTALALVFALLRSFPSNLSHRQGQHMHLCSQRSLWYLGNLVKGIYVNKQKRPNVKKRKIIKMYLIRCS